MKRANDPIDSNKPFLTRLGLRLVAIIAGCVAALLIAYLIMLPTMLLGIKLGPGLGSTAWGLGFFAGYLVYRQLCKRFKLILRYRGGEEELLEKEENEVANTASYLYDKGSDQITDTDVILGDVALTEDDNSIELAAETIEEVTTLSSDGSSTFPEDDNMSETESIIGSQDEVISEVIMGIAEKKNQKNLKEEGTNNSEKASLLSSDKEPIITADTNESNMKRQKSKRRNNLPKWLKIIIIAFVVIALLCAVYLLTSLIYTKVTYPKQAKANDEQLVQQAKDNPLNALEIAQELFKREKEQHQSDYYNFITGRHGTCDFDHIKAGEDAINIYCQYCIDSAKKDVSCSGSIARDLFRKVENDVTYFNNNGDLYFNGDLIQRCRKLCIKTGVDILKYGAEHGEADAQVRLGCYYGGADFTRSGNYWGERTMLGEDVNHEKEAYWYLQAANQGDTKAMGNLGNAYMNGNGVKKNEMQGCYWIQRAANLGDAFFQRVLGDYYRDGVKMQIGSHKKLKPGYSPYYNKYDTYAWEDVPEYETILSQDIEQAKYWWRLAAEKGDETAKERLQQIYD